MPPDKLDKSDKSDKLDKLDKLDKPDKGDAAEKVTATAVGPTIIIRGKLKSDEDLVVQGRIEAEIQSSRALHIENSGIVKANVQVKSARISGVLVGNITAEARLEIAPDGRVVGDMLAPRIVISDGAAFKGRIDMPGFEAPRVEVPAEPAAVAVPVPVPVAPLPPPVPAMPPPAPPPPVAVTPPSRFPGSRIRGS